MKTEELIETLVAAGARPVTPISRLLAAALLVGAALSIMFFIAILSVRQDVADMVFTSAFVFKMIVVLLLAVTAALLLPDSARPLPPVSTRWILLLAPLLLASGAVAELSTVPHETWYPRWIGHNAIHCLLLIPLLSCAPAACVLIALRRAGAPSRPAYAGAVAGLASGGIAAALYALSCPDDSPLFIATWYSLAIGAVMAASAWVGSRVLRW